MMTNFFKEMLRIINVVWTRQIKMNIALLLKITSGFFLKASFAVTIATVSHHYFLLTPRMKTLKKIIHYAAPALLGTLVLTSTPAMAELRNLPITISMKTSEMLTTQELAGVKCATPEESVGVTTGSGTMTVGYRNRGYTGIVTASATDCATQQFVFSNGKMIIKATINGSTLYATYQGSFSQTPGSPTMLTMNKGSKFTITGGTGVFEGASGGGTLSGTVDITSVLMKEMPPVLPGNLEASGSISFSKSAFENAYQVY